MNKLVYGFISNENINENYFYFTNSTLKVNNIERNYYTQSNELQAFIFVNVDNYNFQLIKDRVYSRDLQLQSSRATSLPLLDPFSNTPELNG